MTWVYEIITDGLRETDLIELGGTPEAAAASEGLRLLNRVVASVFGNEVGEKLNDWVLSNAEPYLDYEWWPWDYLPQNIRILCVEPEAKTRKLPPYPQNGDRIQIVDAGANLAENPLTLQRQAALFNGSTDDYVADTEGLNATWMYRADLADWTRVLPLEAGDVFPFPEAHDDAFVGMLATRLNPRYGQGLTPESQASLRRAIGQLKAAYALIREVPTDPALIRLSSNYYGYGGGPVTTQLFLQGRW